MWRRSLIIAVMLIMIWLFFKQLDFVATNETPIVESSLELAARLSPDARVDALVTIAETCLEIGATNKALEVIREAVETGTSDTASPSERLLRAARVHVTAARATPDGPGFESALKRLEHIDDPEHPSADVADAYAWLSLGFRLRGDSTEAARLAVRALARADQLPAASVGRQRDASYLLIDRLAREAGLAEIADEARAHIVDPFYACLAWLPLDLDHAKARLDDMPASDQPEALAFIHREACRTTPIAGEHVLEEGNYYLHAAMARHAGDGARELLAKAIQRVTEIPHPQNRVKFLNHCSQLYHALDLEANGPFMSALRESRKLGQPFYLNHDVDALPQIQVTLIVDPAKDRPVSVIDRAFERLCADETSAFIRERTVVASAHEPGMLALQYTLAVPEVVQGLEQVRQILAAAEAPEATIVASD